MLTDAISAVVHLNDVWLCQDVVMHFLPPTSAVAVKLFVPKFKPLIVTPVSPAPRMLEKTNDNTGASKVNGICNEPVLDATRA
jgi:hypothetical protein